jgi:hypothetical protein
MYDEFKLEIGDLIEVSSKVGRNDKGELVRIWRRARVKEHRTITCGGMNWNKTTYCDALYTKMEKIKVAENWSNPNPKFTYLVVVGVLGQEYTARGVRAHIFDDKKGDDDWRVYTEKEEAKRMQYRFPKRNLPGNKWLYDIPTFDPETREPKNIPLDYDLFRRFKIESTATPEVSRTQLTSDDWPGKYYTAEERHWFIEYWENPERFID